MPKINELPSASSATAADLFAIENSSGTATKHVSGQQIKDFVTADVGAEVTNLKSAITETTRNLFDIEQFAGQSGVTIDENVISGTASDISKDIVIEGGYKVNTQYTVQLSAYTTAVGTSNYGLKVIVAYTDAPTTNVNLILYTNNTGSYTYKTATTESGKTVSKIRIAYSNGATNTWYIKDVQIEEGTTASPYIPHLNALDRYAIRSLGLFITSVGSSPYSSVDDFPTNSIIGVHSGAALVNRAAAVSCEYITIGHNYSAVLQYAIPVNRSNNTKIYARTKSNNVWTEWGIIETDPSAVGYDIYPTGDTTTRETEIASILSVKSSCRLAPGDYYINTLTIPTGKSVIGLGNATRLIRSSQSSSNYMIRMQAYSTLKMCTLAGSDSTITPGSTWDIYAASNPANCAIKIEGSGTDAQEFRVIIDDVHIRSFAGPAIYIRNTGYGPSGGCLIANSEAHNCNAGIVIAEYAEYHRITNCTFGYNYFGAINNGGNNVFTNCDFSKNTQGLLMDNSSGNYGNSSHGSFVGCTFNHSDNNTGTAIELKYMVAGEMFTGCNIFYGAIYIQNSGGIVFNACNFGSSTPITLVSGGGVQFANCVFRTGQTSVNDGRTGKTHFDNCYYIDGTAVNGTPS